MYHLVLSSTAFTLLDWLFENTRLIVISVGIDIGFESGSDPVRQWSFRTPSTTFR
jgi:hypothetical protein